MFNITLVGILARHSEYGIRAPATVSTQHYFGENCLAIHLSALTTLDSHYQHMNFYPLHFFFVPIP